MCCVCNDKVRKMSNWDKNDFEIYWGWAIDSLHIFYWTERDILIRVVVCEYTTKKFSGRFVWFLSNSGAPTKDPGLTTIIVFWAIGSSRLCLCRTNLPFSSKKTGAFSSIRREISITSYLLKWTNSNSFNFDCICDYDNLFKNGKVCKNVTINYVCTFNGVSSGFCNFFKF